ncbi:hypothetical protein [Sphingomonas xinjiangensis]|uniref:hypothetical protein n=1 Tax=Sphingomonas xinjiangensis TaxID=643568 RepID=UPI003CCD5BD6
MTKISLALAGLTMLAPAVELADASPAAQSRSEFRRVEGAQRPSTAVKRVSDWILSSRDNHSFPYAIVDKVNASVFLFDQTGKALGAAPVLIGVALGDDASPGIGSKNLAEIGPAEKTTPAGRFLAKFGLAAGRERVLWVDYATSVAIHPIPKTASKKEARRKRILSPSAEDNRITFGCINVPSAFYGKSVRPLFQGRGGYVYVLPDTKALEAVFPRLRVDALSEHETR